MAPAGPNAWRKAVDTARRYGRWLLLALGVAAVAFLVREAGPDRVLDTLVRAAPWLPAIAALEVAWISMDAVALRLLLRERGREVPAWAWARSAATAYGVMVLLPAGRAGGEVVRAAQLARHVGMLAVPAAAQLQGSTFVANAVISIPCYLAVAAEVGALHQLAWLVALNGLATAVLGVLVLLAASQPELGGRLARRFGFLRPYAAQLDEAARPLHAFPKRAVLCTVTGRVIQAFQYGVILLAIGGVLTPSSALVAQGIHLVGSGLGDLVPNAVGITEAAYRVFAETLGFASDPARAIAIALVARLTQYGLAAVALLLPSPRSTAGEGAAGVPSSSAPPAAANESATRHGDPPPLD